MEEVAETSATPRPRRKKQARPVGNWCVLLEADSLYVVGEYRPLAVELLKQVVPGGARRFYRSVGPEFFSTFSLNQAQVNWLGEAKFFNGTWEVLREYRRPVLDVLSLEYPEIWLVENGQSRPHQLPADQEEPAAQKYALGSVIVMPLAWARSYTLYCHRHHTWETNPCKEAGVIAERETKGQDKGVSKVEAKTKEASKLAEEIAEEEATPKKKKWPDLELHAPSNTLVRATRQQVSYYLAAVGEPVRLGRDAAGETASRPIIEAQRLALVLRAARAMTMRRGAVYE